MSADRATALPRLVIFAPHGDDANIVGELCIRAGLEWAAVTESKHLCAAVGETVLGWVVTEEALANQASHLAGCLTKQPPWSDLPVILLTASRRQTLSSARDELFDHLGHVTLLERPLRAETLLRALRAVARTRARQYQLRDKMLQLEDSANELERRVAQRTEELQAAVARREFVEKALVQAQRLEAIGRLTGGVAHDFNNLLQVIVSASSVLEHAGDNPALRKRAIDSIRQTAARGSRLNQQLLAFASRQPLAAETLDLRAQLKGLTDMLHRSVRGDISVSVHAPDNLWFVHADTAQLDVAILNLVVNARDAMPDGGKVMITLRNEVVPASAEEGRVADERFVVIDVADTGHGMDEETASQAFEPFFTTKERGKGTGLGLSQVYGFARQSGGAAVVKNSSSAGTVMSIRLPAVDVGAPSRKEAAPDFDHQTASSWRRILVVEDEPAVAEATCQVLQSLGFDTELAHSADEALRLPLDDIDAVFSDVIMPGRMDGVALAQKLSAAHPKLPILLTSGYVGVPERVSDSGFRLLSKPYTSDQLQRALNELAAEYCVTT